MPRKQRNIKGNETTRLTIDIPLNLHKRLTDLAHEKQVSMAYLVQDILERNIGRSTYSVVEK